MADVQKLEYIFDNKSHITNHLSPDLLADHEELAVYVYLRKADEAEPFLIGNYDVTLDHGKPQEGDRPDSPSYKEKVKAEVTTDDLVFNMRIVYV